MNLAAITFDFDWAPDWTVEACAEICVSKGAPVTLFATHRSSLLAGLSKDSRFEIGIHPNFLPGSTQGETPEDVLAYCLEIVTDARAMRTHSLVQSTQLFRLVTECYPMIDTDVSLFLPGHPGLSPFDFYLGDGMQPITRLPYYWEDDIASVTPSWDWEAPPPASSGLCIFNFHPVLVCLNATTPDAYVRLKESLGSRPLLDATPRDFEPFVQTGPGTRTFLERTIVEIGSAKFRSVSSIADEYRRGRPADKP